MAIRNNSRFNFEYIHYLYPVHPVYPCSFSFSIFYHKKSEVREGLKIAGEIVSEKEDNGEGYYAYSPTLPGCYSNGPTIEITKQFFRIA